MKTTNVKLPSLVEHGRAQQRHDTFVNDVLAGMNNAGALVTNEAQHLVPLHKPTRDTDHVHDGAVLGGPGLFSPLTSLRDVPPVLPDNGAPVRERVLLVNGIMTDLELQKWEMQGLANTGCAVIGIHNSTKGMAKDLLECVLNKLNTGDTPAIDTLSRALALALENKEPVRIVGHSQGALIIARALQKVSSALSDGGVDSATIKQLLSRISVETYGGAASNYVDGPRYTHVVNKADVVPMLTGVGLDSFNPFGSAGEGAVFQKFTEAHLPKDLPLKDGVTWAAARAVDQAVHGARHVYFAHRAAALKASDDE